MADRKNQHFVPRAVLKPWTLNCEGRAIHLYNIRADRGIPNAPVKSQCSRDYFYGSDLRLETWLGHGEGVYAEAVRRLPSSNSEDIRLYLDILKQFTLLQMIRTERSLAEEARMLREMYDHVFHGVLPDGERFPTHEEIVRDAIERWHKSKHSLEDLKGVLVVNDSAVPFVVTDDPAVHTNKLHIHKLGSANFGIQQSGMILTMPISPGIAVLFYDGHVYTCPGKTGPKLRITSDSDAKAFNELQYLKANENIYFGDWGQLQAIRSGFQAVADRRLEVHFRFNLLVPVEGKDDTFVVADDISLAPEGRSIIHTESISFEPRSWPSLLRYRTDMFGFSNGSGAGYLRDRWAKQEGWTRSQKVVFR